MRVRPSNTPQSNQALGVKRTVHNIIISDASGSMAGSKYRASVQSILTELVLMSKDDNVHYTQTLVEFDSGRNISHFWMTEGKEAVSFKPIQASGGTPLYNTMGDTFTKLEKEIPQGDLVLVKIFTDGEDTERGRGSWDASSIGTYIRKLIDVNKWAITFNCTKWDVAYIKRLGIPDSNILTHDNTAQDIERVGNLRSMATMTYSKSVSRGVTADALVSNFYSKSVD